MSDVTREPFDPGRIETRELEQEMRSSFLDYAMSVIVARALPDVRDGLKPVHRRVLYGMHEAGMQPNRPYKKCARIVGDVMGSFHPHGDTAIYDTLVRLAQSFSMRYPLVDGQGNFGNIDDYPAAAMRYCVANDTRVATPNGVVRIDALVGHLQPESEREAAFDVLDRLARPVRVSKVFHSGEHATLKLRTREGLELTGTHNHPVLCLVDMVGVPLLLWKLLDEIKPGDRVVVSRSPLGGGPAEFPPQSEDEVPFVADLVRSETDSYRLRRSNAGHWERGGTAILERIESEEVKRVVEPLVSGDYYYATVESVTDAGVQPVFSLRVDSDDHSFLTNGFVSHNTECRLTRLATEMLRDIDADTVDFQPNYDESRREPTVLPARFPNLLVNGSSGIAVGMATNIPPHRLTETVDAITAMIDDPDIDVDRLMRHVKGPDFPTGGIILGRDGIREAYRSGRGRILVRARAHIEELRGGKTAIVVTELPYGVKKGGDTGVIKKIADLVNDKVLTEISDLADHSDKSGMRIQIDLKRDAIPQVALNKLFKHTTLQTTFGYNGVALVDGVPRTLGLRDMLRHYLDFQRQVVTRRLKHELRQAERRAHVLAGYLIALDNLDEVIALIRGAADTDAAREALMSRFELSEVQAQAILDLRLRALTALERKRVEDEHEDLRERIEELRAILGDPARIDGVIREELLEVKQIYARHDDRRTEIVAAEGELELEDLIAEEDMVIAITRSGYVKRLPVSTYREQRRGGIGVMGMELKDEDFIQHLFVASTHDYLLFFTSVGKVYRLKVHELPLGSRQSKGRAIVNLLPFRQDEKVRAVIQTRNFEEAEYLVFATKNGVVKKTRFADYNTPLKADGIIAIKMREDDELIGVRNSSGADDLLLVSRKGQAIRFHEREVRPMGRATEGVRGMALRRGDEVISVNIAQNDADLLVVTENGYGKRTRIDEYPTKGRGGLGVKTVQLTEARGQLVDALIAPPGYQIMLISDGGTVIRIPVEDIKRLGRATQGVIVMRLRGDEKVSTLAPVVESDDDVVADGALVVAPEPPAEEGAAPDGA